MRTETECFICGQAIADEEQRLVLLNRNLCSCCEKKLISTTAEDESYEVFKDKIKNLWFS